MAELILQSETQTPMANFVGANAYLRIYASDSFYSSNGTQVTGGAVGSPNWYQQYTCPISNGLITIPQVTLQTTTDSNLPNVTYTAVFFSAAGALMNPPKLSNFFVDPQYLQSNVQSNVIVAGAGTSAANGTYTYRGQHNTRNYWTLYGQSDSFTNYAIAWDSANWLMTSGAGATLYTINTSSQYPWDSIWSIPSGDTGLAPVPAVAEGPTVIAATWAELTISNQGHSLTFWDRSTWDVQQIKQYINLLGQNVPYASSIVAGKTYLTRDPVLSTDPIAVASNDYDWLAIKQTIYLDGPEYQGNLANAITGIGSTPTELRITSNVAVAADTSIPSNILISREGNGQFTVTSGKTLTIASLAPNGNRQIFYGAGRVILGANSVAGSEFLASWWVGISNSTDITFQVQQMMDSAAQSVDTTSSRGAIVRFGTGTWYFADISIPNLVTIAGAGNSIDGGAYSTPDVGTTLKIPVAKINTALCTLRLPSQYYGQRLQGFNLSIGDSLTASSLLGEGDLQSGLGFSATYVTFQGTLGAVGGNPGDGPQLVRFHYTNVNNAEFVGNKLTQCWFQVPEASTGFYCDSINTVFTMDTCQFQCAKKATGRKIVRLGWFLELNPDNRGVNTYNFTETFERTIASATITQNGSSYSSTMVLDPSTPSDKQFKSSDMGEPIICGGFTAYPQRFIDEFTAILSFHPDAPITAQPATVYRFNDFEDTAYTPYDLSVGAVNQFQVIGGADEGFNYSLLTANGSLICDVNFQSYTAQGRVAFNGATKTTFRNCALNSCALEDNTTDEDIAVVLDDCQWTIFTPFKSSLLTTQVWRNYDSSTRRILESGVQPNYTSNTGEGFYEYPYIDRKGNVSRIINPQYLDPTEPSFGIGVSSGLNIPAIRLGKVTSTVPVDEWQYYYDLTWDNNNGRLAFTGNQTGVKGYTFDGPVYTNDAVISNITSDTTIVSTGSIKGIAKGATKGIGYGTGAGAPPVTQLTDRSTGVTMNAQCGYIVSASNSLAASTFVDFVVTNNCVEAGDRIAVDIQGAPGTTMPFCVSRGTGTFTIRLWNLSTTTADTSPTFVGFIVLKAVIA